MVILVDIIKIKDEPPITKGDSSHQQGSGGLGLEGLTPLSQWLSEPLDTEAFLNLAISCAQSLHDLHMRHLVHWHVSLHSLWLDNATGRISLSESPDLSAAEGGDEAESYNRLYINDLPYMSPEQTGRLNFPADSRSDLYSLGVVYYQILTGRLPFTAHDLLEWVHSHIARSPRPPFEVRPAVPMALSDIVMKLLEKTAENRYQTALGLINDLKECQRQWSISESIEKFQLGRQDNSGRLMSPQVLYGRDTEVSILNQAYRRVSKGRSEAMLVSGYAGVGKTFLVREIIRPVMQNGGIYIEGKFDLLKRSLPYSAIIQAFQELVKQLLLSRPERLLQWRRDILDGLGANAQVIVDIIPDFELIIGPQTAVPELGPDESRNRFFRTFQNLVRVLARRDHPLVLFVDDLQFADAASLRLLEELLTDITSEHVLFIAACRAGDRSGLQSGMSSLHKIRDTGMKITRLELQPLGVESLNLMIAGILNSHHDLTRDFSAIIWRKTMGNPFSVIQVLKKINDEGHLSFNMSANQWEWDLQSLESNTVCENVVNLIVGRLAGMSDGSRRTLSLAACIGPVFTLNLLARIAAMPEGDVAESLAEALWEGMIEPRHGLGGIMDRSDGWPSVSYRFAHDRVQEAAYTMIDVGKLNRIHYQIGSVLLAEMNDSELREHLFNVVDHLDRGRDYIINQSEKAGLINLNLIAGKRAKASTAYDKAAEYLQVAVDLLRKDSWEDDYDLTYEVYRELAECEYLCGRHGRTEGLFVYILDHCRNKIDRAGIINLMMVLYATMGRYTDNNRLGIEALGLFDYNFPDIEDRAAIKKALDDEIAIYRKRLGGRQIRDLLDIPVVASPEREICNRLFISMFTSAFISHPLFFMLIVVKAINDLMENGAGYYSDNVFAVAALILGTYLNDYQAAYEFGQLAWELNEKNHNPSTRPIICHVIGGMVHHWMRPLGDSLLYTREAVRSGLETGDYLYVGHAASALLRIIFNEGRQTLPQMLAEVDKLMPFFNKSRNEPECERQQMIRHMYLNLMGRTQSMRSFSSDEFEEDQHLQKLTSIQHGTGIGGYYLAKMQSLAIYGLYAEAVEMGNNAERYWPFMRSFPHEVELYFYLALSILAFWQEQDRNIPDEQLQRVQKLIRQMETWAGNCPENYFSRYALLQAETSRANLDYLDAESWYEQAIKVATEQGTWLLGALSFERAASFYKQRGMDRFASCYIKESRSLYEAWGAEGKAKQLEKEAMSCCGAGESSDPYLAGARMEGLDALAVVAASQAISGEIELSALMERLMTTMMENAGAQNGALVIPGDGGLRVAASARFNNEHFEIRISENQGSDSVHLPESLMHYVMRTRDKVLLDDARESNLFSADEYFINHEAVSVACLPLLRQNDLIAVLYLENNLVKGAFNTQRVSVLELLASQAAISLENASLFEERRQMENELRERSQTLSDIIEFLPDATVVVNNNGRVLFWNRAMEAMSGIKANIIMRKDTLHYSVPFYGEKRPVLLNLVMNPDSGYESLYRWIRRDGDYLFGEARVGDGRYLLGAAAILRNTEGLVMGAIETVRDISESRRAEEEMDRLRRLLKSIIDSMPSVLIGLDKEGRVMQWNAEAVRRTGMDNGEALGRSIDEVMPELASQTTRLMQAMAERRTIRQDRLAVESDGETFYYDLMMYPLGAEGLEGAVVRVDDATEKVRLQEMMIQSEKMMSIGGLAAGMAHEINNPLSGILQASQNIAYRLSPDLQRNVEAAAASGTSMEAINAYMEKRQIPKFLDGIRNSGSRAAQIITNMLQFSRRSELSAKPASIQEILDRSLALAANDYDLKKGFDFRHVSIIKEYEGDMPTILCSPTEIEQVILNLLKNAAHAMAEHTYSDSAGPRIILRSYREGDFTVVEVEDNGPGMSESVRKKVFEPFFTTKQAGVGTGLGMSVSYFIIVNNHHGQMAVESQPGEGTRVIIRLPFDGVKAENSR